MIKEKHIDGKNQARPFSNAQINLALRSAYSYFGFAEDTAPRQKIE